MKKLINQAFSFLIFSGIGWLIDFTIFNVISMLTTIPIFFINIISSIPAITFVFFFCLKKTFKPKHESINAGCKYLIYVVYQMVLLVVISFFAQWLYNIFTNIVPVDAGFFKSYGKLMIKIIITPITMAVNFLVMKLIIEKI